MSRLTDRSTLRSSLQGAATGRGGRRRPCLPGLRRQRPRARCQWRVDEQQSGPAAEEVVIRKASAVRHEPSRTTHARSCRCLTSDLSGGFVEISPYAGWRAENRTCSSGAHRHMCRRTGTKYVFDGGRRDACKKNDKEKMRLPGVEPGSIAWKAIILTVGLQTLWHANFHNTFH